MYGRIFVDDLSKKYSDACCKFDINVGQTLKKLFPKMDISCRKNNGKRGTSYSGIYWKHDASLFLSKQCFHPSQRDFLS
jgi:hypothetical protein